MFVAATDPRSVKVFALPGRRGLWQQTIRFRIKNAFGGYVLRDMGFTMTTDSVVEAFDR